MRSLEDDYEDYLAVRMIKLREKHKDCCLKEIEKVYMEFKSSVDAYKKHKYKLMEVG